MGWGHKAPDTDKLNPDTITGRTKTDAMTNFVVPLAKMVEWIT